MNIEKARIHRISRVYYGLGCGLSIMSTYRKVKSNYKTDFSYTIMGNGCYLGASNAQAGRIEPDIEPGE